MANNFLWLCFRIGITFGIVALTLMNLTARVVIVPKSIIVFMKICWLLCIIFGAFVSIQWCF